MNKNKIKGMNNIFLKQKEESNEKEKFNDKKNDCITSNANFQEIHGLKSNEVEHLLIIGIENDECITSQSIDFEPQILYLFPIKNHKILESI